MYQLYVTTDRKDGGIVSDVISFSNRQDADFAALQLEKHSEESKVIYTRVTKLY